MNSYENPVILRARFGKVLVICPPTLEFIHKATALHGTSYELGARWILPLTKYQDVRQALLDVYGEDGVTEPQRCGVELTITKDYEGLHFFGRILFFADEPGPGVELLTGGVQRKPDALIIKAGTKLLIWDVPEAVAGRTFKHGTIKRIGG